jgi:prolipoprotein diacylglyceryltransferase
MFIDLVEQKLNGSHVHVRWAGMTSFWGYLAGFAAIVITCRDHRIALGKLADIAIVPLGFSLMFARIGSFLAVLHLAKGVDRHDRC